MLSVRKAKKHRKTVKSLISDMFSIIPCPECTREMAIKSNQLKSIEIHQRKLKFKNWATGAILGGGHSHFR
jgi:hypothetical protein